MQHPKDSTDDGYLNDFHREWDERCLKENEAMKSRHFSAEYLRAQSQRMRELVRLQEEVLRKQRRSSSKSEREQQESNTQN